MKRVLVLLLIGFAAVPAWLAGSGEGQPAQEEKPLRIVTCGKAHSLVLHALYMFPDASDTMVAFGRSSQVGGRFVSLLDPEAEKRAVLAPDAGVEEILAHKPDWVVLKSYLKSGLGRQLEDIGMSVLYLDLENPEQFRRDTTAIGELFGNPDRAMKLNRFFAENLESIQKRSALLAEEEKPTTLLLYYGTRSGTSSFNIPPKQWLQARMVQWAGGNPVWFEAAAGSGWQQVNFEQIAAWNPEYILLVSYHSPVDEVKKNLISDPKWSQLKAVQRGHLLAFPVDYLSWDQPDPRWILGLHWMAAKLHPQASASTDMESRVVEFYSFVYGLSEKQITRQIVPRIRGDYP
jgi:iron complex transport system substrate-binding protein